MKPFTGSLRLDRRAILSSLAALALVSASLHVGPASAQAQLDALPSWNDGPTKSSILEFVKRVTDHDGPHFVPSRQRIATFDNDDTLWGSTQCMYNSPLCSTA